MLRDVLSDIQPRAGPALGSGHAAQGLVWSGLEMSKDGDSTEVFLQENLNTQYKNLIFR